MKELETMDDWRLTGQEEYLQGVRLIYSKYTPYREGWDHDHCEFCSRKLAVEGGDFTEGNSTVDRYYWICPECFEDFKDQFQWSTTPDDTTNP